jgi:hypothetical protein
MGGRAGGGRSLQARSIRFTRAAISSSTNSPLFTWQWLPGYQLDGERLPDPSQCRAAHQTRRFGSGVGAISAS